MEGFFYVSAVLNNRNYMWLPLTLELEKDNFSGQVLECDTRTIPKYESKKFSSVQFLMVFLENHQTLMLSLIYSYLANSKCLIWLGIYLIKYTPGWGGGIQIPLCFPRLIFSRDVRITVRSFTTCYQYG